LHNGQAALSYSVDENRVTLEFGPVDFIQVNRDVNVSMVRKAVELLDPTSSDSVLDLFCGLGNFSLSLETRPAGGGGGGRRGFGGQGQSQRCPHGIVNASFHADNLFEPGRPDHGPKMPMIWCFWTPQGRARLKSWNVCHSGAAPARVYFVSSREFGSGCGILWVPTGSG